MVDLANDAAEPVSADELSTQIRILAGNASFETTPKQATKISSFSALLPEATRVFIAFIPGETTSNIVATARRLVDEGMVPVPHLPARNMTSSAMFEQLVGDLADAGVDQALAIAGGLKEPSGPYHASMQLMETGLFETHGFKTLFVAGHPEGSPDISDRHVEEALAWKNAFASKKRD